MHASGPGGRLTSEWTDEPEVNSLPPVQTIAALHGSAALLLVLAGSAKLARPRAAADLLGVLGLPARAALARAVGSAETVAGLAALALGGPVASGTVAVLYAGFALAVLRALAAGAPSCGCFGSLDAPPSWIHVTGNLALAGVSLVAVGSADSPVGVLAAATTAELAGGAALALLIVTIAGLLVVTFTALPEALQARRRPGLVGGDFRVVPGWAPSSAGPPEHLRSRS